MQAIHVLLLNERASLQEEIDDLEKLKTGWCNLKETFDTMIANIKERVRELKAHLSKVIVSTSTTGRSHFRLLQLSGHQFRIPLGKSV